MDYLKCFAFAVAGTLIYFGVIFLAGSTAGIAERDWQRVNRNPHNQQLPYKRGY